MSRFLWSDFEFEGEPAGSSSKSHTGRRKGKGDGAPRPVPPGSDPQAPLTVSQLNACVAAAIQAQIPKIWVVGEISDFSQPRSGHVYLTLKDEASQIRAVMWRSAVERLGFQLEDGQSVIGFGRIDVYSPRGAYQIVLEKLEPQGEGKLQLAFRQLHAKLEKEGLFDAERKRPLPRFPRRVGFVTSPTGAAIRDFLEIARRRWPSVQIIVIPARVQGEGAAEEIVQGIQTANKIRPKLDVLVVGRGGGSMEDLWCFNDERVLRALAASPVPTVSAVGHEIDVTLSDLVADLRALTPSEAAERIIPNQMEVLDWVQSLELRGNRAILGDLERWRMRLDHLRQRPVLVRPDEIILSRTQRLDEYVTRLEQGIDRQLRHQTHRLEKLAATVEALSPVKTLHRGFSICRDRDSGAIVRSVEDLGQGQEIETEFVDGRVLSQVRKIIVETNQRS